MVIRFLNKVDRWIVYLVWISVALVFIELTLGTEHSLGIFLWIERLLAVIFTLEYIGRIYEEYKHPEQRFDIGPNYVISPMGAIDLLSIVPFWVGFICPISWLGWIRALRILRLLKMLRYWRSLQLVALAFYKSWYFLKPLFFALIIIVLFSSVLLYQAEHISQPEAYGNIWNCFWFSMVSATTVGYGDISPITPLGKILCSITIFFPALLCFAAIVGTIGNSYQLAMELEENPDIDPIEEFKKIYRSRH